MIKILSSGYMKRKPIKKFCCDYCACVYKTDEYEIYPHNQYFSTNRFYSVCPECERKVYTH